MGEKGEAHLQEGIKVARTNSVVKFLMLLIVTGSFVRRLLDKSLFKSGGQKPRAWCECWNFGLLIWIEQTAKSGQSVNQSSLGASAARCLMQFWRGKTDERELIDLKHHEQTECPTWKESQLTQEAPSGCSSAGSWIWCFLKASEQDMFSDACVDLVEV